MLKQCDVCVDIGGSDFDHHQRGFNKRRVGGIKYASAGLVQEKYGMNVIHLLASKYFPKPTYNAAPIFYHFDNNVISLVDCEDNGVPTESHCFSFISSFLPLWFNNSTDDFNNQFYKVLVTTMAVLEEELKTVIGKNIAQNIITWNWGDSNFFKNGILEIPSQTIDRVETVTHINKFNETNQINFVIFPYPMVAGLLNASHHLQKTNTDSE